MWVLKNVGVVLGNVGVELENVGVLVKCIDVSETGLISVKCVCGIRKYVGNIKFYKYITVINVWANFIKRKHRNSEGRQARFLCLCILHTTWT